MEDLLKTAQLMAAEHVMILIDACHSGFAARAKGGPELELGLWDRWDETAEVVLTASRDDELSYEAYQLGHSVFTLNLLEGLDPEHGPRADKSGDGVVTDAELALWIEEAAARPVPGVPAKQSPQTYRSPASRGQFLLVPER